MEDVRSLVEALGDWAERLMPESERARRLQDDLRRLLAEELDPSTPLSREVLDIVERTCHRTARHLTLQQHPEPGRPDEHAPGWPPASHAEIAARAGNVRSVRRHGRSGELRLDGFDEVAHAAPYLRAAFTLLHDCDAVIIDLRSNGGGALSALTLVAEFVLGPEPVHLATVHYRDRSARQWWTVGSLGAGTLRRDARVAVLIGPGTYSSGEALAYHLQHRGRVRTFGSRTPGAADHVTPIRVTPTVTALMPEATPVDSVTGSNWEGDGVSADVECDPADASSVARDWLDRAASSMGGPGHGRATSSVQVTDRVDG